MSTVFLPHNVRASPRVFRLSAIYGFFLPQAMEQHSVNGIPVPVSMWELRAGVSNGRRDSVWAVFRSHEEVRFFSVLYSFFSSVDAFFRLWV